LLQLTRGKFTNISFISRLPNYVVNTTAVWGGNLYIGTDAGLIVLRDHVPIENDLTKMLADIRIRSMMVDSRNQLWICTFERYGALLVKRDGSFVSINENGGLANNRVRCVMETGDGDIYTGSSGGISVIRNERVVRKYTKDDGLANDVILSLCEGPGGIIYAGSDGGGIYAIDAGGIAANYAEKDGLASGIILRMASTDDGVWISTGNAVCYMDGTATRGGTSAFGPGGGFRVIDKLVLHDDSVFGIKIIGNEIWFLRSKSVSICGIQNLLSGSELKMKRLQRRDGLSSSVTANSWSALDDDGTLYICTSTGVFSIDTHAFRQNAVVPYAGIPAIFADGRQVFETDGVLPIAGDTQRIDIHIALLSFASKEGTLSYMLEGFDNEVTTIGRNDISRISYTNLNGGKYTFRLYGTNADGIQSETVVLVINKEYAFFEMLFVRILLGLFLTGAVVLCVRAFISQRTKILIGQRQEYKEVAAQIMAVAASMADLKEEHITDHSRRIAAYSKMIGERLGMPEHELETLYYAALLHDIGLVGIPDSILNKNGRLTDEELGIVKKHVAVGGDLLKDITVMGDIAAGAKYHHERIDGKGYAGLKGDEIPLMAKIICVCNAFDSMLSDQAYRKALSIERVQSEFISNAGTQFDEKITAVLISLINEGEVPL
jgi:energy-coupling factor transport system substrate-specific component